MTRNLHQSRLGETRPGVPDETAPGRDESNHLAVDPYQDRPTSQVDSRSAGPQSDIPVAPRCDEKGCVFPVVGPGRSKCLAHSREEYEPKHFGSSQPTVLLLDRAKYGLPDPETEPDDSRARDRRRELAERAAFLEETA